MNNKTLKVLSFSLLGVVVLVLVVATPVEKLCGSPFVLEHVYGSPWFAVLWAVMALCALAYVLRRKLWRRWATFSLHLSFLVILAGALVTHLFGWQGSVRLRQDEAPADRFVLSGGGGEKAFPFRVSLKDFYLEYYTGTFAPMDFVSTIVVHDEDGDHEGLVAMNHIYSYRNYRFYQSKYDEDGRGTTLSVSHDPWGIAVTYTGYALLLLSMIAFFFRRGSGFRALLRHPALRKVPMVCLLLWSAVGTMQASERRPPVLPKQLAEGFGDLYIYYNDRICPLQTLAKDFTVKLYGKQSYKGFTAEQVLTGWFFYYDDWKAEPMIRIKSKEVGKALGLDGKYARLVDFVDVKGYKLESALCGADGLKAWKDLEAANEKFNLVSMVTTGSMLRIYPYHDGTDGQTVWYSLADKLPQDMPEDQWIFIRSSMNYVAEKIAGRNYEEASALLEKIKKYQRREAGGLLPADTRFTAEKVYNRMNYNRPLAMVCAAIGIFAFLFYIRSMVAPGGKKNRMQPVLNGLLAVVFLYLTVMIAFRGYVSGHIPLSNGFETMQFMAWCSVLLTFVLQRRFAMAVPFGLLLCGLTLMVSMMGEANPQITRLMPVLSSPLLSIHVVVIMMAYSLLAFAMLNGVTAAVLHFSGKAECAGQIGRLLVISRLILYPAIFLLAIGIFVGAVWANVSWGRYWGWDPKEVWALITLLVYSLALHADSLPCFRRPMFFHVFCIVAFLTVLITYFGVNFLLGGMHSYA